MKRKKGRARPARKEPEVCSTCFGVGEVAFIGLPPGQRVRRCPDCSGKRNPARPAPLLPPAFLPTHYFQYPVHEHGLTRSKAARVIVNEMCACGAFKTQHAPTLSEGHGPCKFTDCAKFTWDSWVEKKAG